MVTIDNIVNELGTIGPYLIKLHVQGAELEVLRGAEYVLADGEFIVLEVSFFKCFHGGSEYADVPAYMRDLEFVFYDSVGLQYQPLNPSLAQTDIAFVNEDGQFCRHHDYANPAQHAEQNARMKQHLRELLGSPRP